MVSKPKKLAKSPKRKPKEDRPDPKWARTSTGFYHRLVNIDPEASGLKGTSGVYVVWHTGARPTWLYVGRSEDLATTFYGLADDQDIMTYEIHGGVYATWALIRPEFQSGVVGYLNRSLRPKIKNPDHVDLVADPVPVRPPQPRSKSG